MKSSCFFSLAENLKGAISVPRIPYSEPVVPSTGKRNVYYRATAQLLLVPVLGNSCQCQPSLTQSLATVERFLAFKDPNTRCASASIQLFCAEQELNASGLGGVR